MYTVTIDRPNWLRGREAQENPFLLTPDKKKYDIIGKMMLEAGYSTNDIAGVRFPSTFVERHCGRRDGLIGRLAWMVCKARVDVEEVMEILRLNDDPTITDEVRERELAKILERFAYIPKFTNESRELPSEPTGYRGFVNRYCKYNDADQSFYLIVDGLKVCTYKYLYENYSKIDFREFTEHTLRIVANNYGDWERRKAAREAERLRQVEEESRRITEESRRTVNTPPPSVEPNPDNRLRVAGSWGTWATTEPTRFSRNEYIVDWSSMLRSEGGRISVDTETGRAEHNNVAVDLMFNDLWGSVDDNEVSSGNENTAGDSGIRGGSSGDSDNH